MLYTPSRRSRRRSILPRYRHDNPSRNLRRAAIIGIAAACTIGAFAIGAATQRVENALAETDKCTRTSNFITCIIVLDEVLDVVVEPPSA